MSDEQKKKLEQQLWNIANTLRGKMDADEFRDYILGFIFFKYLSERMEAYADSLLKQDALTYHEVNEKTAEGQKFLDAIKEASLDALGYFLKPSELFSSIARRGNGNGKDKNGDSESTFILEDLAAILNNIEQSTMGTESEDDFDNLFEDLDLTSTKLGRTESAKNELISKVLAHLDKIDFQLQDSESDVLGDAYEYLIGQFASGAGKKAGEFYTPQEVSRVLAKIVAGGKEKLKSVYDPTCGSGSLLLRVAKEVKEVGKFYGQELNRTTYNLARMNMILHGVHYQKFDIRQEDSLERPQHFDERFEAIVANPPFSAKWSANPLHLTDDRFSQYGRLAPSSKADFAFIQHMIHQLGDNGTMAVVVPHGVLFRGGAEGHIRQYLIEDRNYLDAVIGLPWNIFYGTDIPTCILVFKKCRERPENILFIDASEGFGRAPNQNLLRQEDIEKIINVYFQRLEENRYSSIVSLDEIKRNKFNLNIPRYVDRYDPEPEYELGFVSRRLGEVQLSIKKNDESILKACQELGISGPEGDHLVLLRQFKRGLMQQLFSRKIRFKANSGENFPEWKSMPLSEASTRVRRTIDDQVGLPVMTISGGFGFLNQEDRFSKVIAGSSLANYIALKEGELAYNRGNSKSAKYGYVSVMRREMALVPYVYHCFRMKSGFDPLFVEYFATTDFVGRQLRRVITSTARGNGLLNISTNDFFDTKFEFPHLEEQTRIVELLSAIDRKIDLLVNL